MVRTMYVQELWVVSVWTLHPKSKSAVPVQMLTIFLLYFILKDDALLKYSRQTNTVEAQPKLHFRLAVFAYGTADFLRAQAHPACPAEAACQIQLHSHNSTTGLLKGLGASQVCIRFLVRAFVW